MRTYTISLVAFFCIFPSLLSASIDTATQTSEAINSTFNSLIEMEDETSLIDKPIEQDMLCVPDIPLPDFENALITKYRNQYTAPNGIKYLSAVMQRSIPYRSFIEEEITRLEVPASLLFLPVIESGFSVTAISRSGAMGMWQFMKCYF